MAEIALHQRQALGRVAREVDALGGGEGQRVALGHRYVRFDAGPLGIVEVGIDVVLVDVDVADAEQRVFRLGRCGCFRYGHLVVFEGFVVLSHVLVDKAELGERAQVER